MFFVKDNSANSVGGTVAQEDVEDKITGIVEIGHAVPSVDTVSVSSESSIGIYFHFCYTVIVMCKFFANYLFLIKVALFNGYNEFGMFRRWRG